MARNRKRRSEGRPDRPSGGGVAEPGVATARRGNGPAPLGNPNPLDHAAGEAEIVEAQLARGRAQDAEAPGGQAPEYDDGDVELDEDFDEREINGDAGGGWRGGRGDRGGRGGREGRDGDARPGSEGGGALVPKQSSTPAARIVHFLQGSWRELQRVQWPDRPQVMQATGVVIGFVIIAGLFLGLSDFVSQRIVNFILK